MNASTFLSEGQQHCANENYLAAFEAWQKGAEENDLDCMWKIFDFLYLDGELEFEDVAPIHVYAEMAAANDAHRAWTLGEYYLEDCSDTVKGLLWLTRAAQQSPLYANKFGDLLADGRHIKADVTQALHWWQTAAQTDGNAAYCLAERYQKGQSIAVDMQRAIDWMQHGANLGHESCMNVLANAYAAGKHIEKDEALAISWWEKLASQNHSYAYKLGELFLAGKLITKNERKAVEWFQVAARAGHVIAIQKLERMGIKPVK